VREQYRRVGLVGVNSAPQVAHLRLPSGDGGGVEGRHAGEQYRWFCPVAVNKLPHFLQDFIT
jgi:hypothetical protein